MSSPRDGEWRVGSHYDLHVYCGDRPVATFHTAADAYRAVRDHNDALILDKLADEIEALPIADGWNPQAATRARALHDAAMRVRAARDRWTG